MTPLPDANAETRAYFMDWLETFSSYVRNVDYASARPLRHPDVLVFGRNFRAVFYLLFRVLVFEFRVLGVTMYPDVNPETCNGCENCVEICPSEVYQLEGERSNPAHPEDCIECWACVNQCPTESIQLQED